LPAKDEPKQDGPPPPDAVASRDRDDPIGRYADAWITIFGDDAEWHATRKADELEDMGDALGAAELRQIVAVIEARGQSRSWRTFFKRVVNALRTKSCSRSG
jgi:hypothetical protein